VAELFELVHEARDYIAGAELLVKVAAEPREVVEDFVAYIFFQCKVHHEPVALERHVCNCHKRAGREKRQHEFNHSVSCGVRVEAVYDIFEYQRVAYCEPAIDER